VTPFPPIQVHKKAGRGKWSVPEAFAFIEGVCHHTNFRKYEYIPPKMVSGCHRYVCLGWALATPDNMHHLATHLSGAAA
jgi:hypothetical protein